MCDFYGVIIAAAGPPAQEEQSGRWAWTIRKIPGKIFDANLLLTCIYWIVWFQLLTNYLGDIQYL